MLVEPSNGLQERLLLRKLLVLLTQITSHRKSMHNTTEQIDLVGLLSLNEDFLGAVPFLGWEDLVCLGGGNAQGSSDGRELRFVDKGRVSDEADINTFARLQEANGIFCTLGSIVNQDSFEQIRKLEHSRSNSLQTQSL